MLAVFRKDLRLFLRDRSALVFSLLMPIFVITVIAEGLFHGDGGPKLLIPVVNEDGGPVAGTFQKLLAEHADVREMSREEAERLVRDKHDAPAAIVFPAKLSKQYLQGRSSEILLLTDPASGTDLQAVKVLLLLMDKEAAALADPFAEEKITLTEQNLTGNRLAVTVFEQRVPGFALMFVLLAVVFGTSMGIHDEREVFWCANQTSPPGLVCSTGLPFRWKTPNTSRTAAGFTLIFSTQPTTGLALRQSSGNTPPGSLLSIRRASSLPHCSSQSYLVLPNPMAISIH